ncbi:hypothetical protein ACS22U_24465, partial [Escherichia coli]
AIYVLWMYQRTMTGPTSPEVLAMPDLDRREVAAMAPVVVALVLFGFFPGPLLDVIDPAVETTLQQVGVSDDGPVVPAADPSGATGEGAE